MDVGKELDKQETLSRVKVGDYLRWRSLPFFTSSDNDYYCGEFIGLENEWQYALVLDILESPRKKKGEHTINGIHIRLLKNGEIDWIFNFELFNEIEIVGSSTLCED